MNPKRKLSGMGRAHLATEIKSEFAAGHLRCLGQRQQPWIQASCSDLIRRTTAKSEIGLARPGQGSPFRNGLTDCHYDLDKRLQLFCSTVWPTLLYGRASWTMARSREMQIRTIQWKMMRTIIGTRRLARGDALENWID